MSLRDIWHGIGSLWNWWLDPPIWLSIPLAAISLLVICALLIDAYILLAVVFSRDRKE